MRLLRAFEYVAVLLILVGIVGGLLKALADFACSLSPSQVVYSAPILAPTQAEKEIYLASLKRQVNALEAKLLAEAK